MRISIYTKPHCSFCFAAKNVLARRGLPFEEIPVTNAAEEMQMREITGGRTVPQILLDGVPIGGYMELAELESDGGLEKLLGTGA